MIFSRRALLTGVTALAAAWFLLPKEVAAQVCVTSGGSFGPPTLYTCTLPAGSFTEPISFQAPGSGDTVPLVLNSQLAITVTASQGNPLTIEAQAGGEQGAALGMTINNQGALTVNSGSLSGNLFGMYVQQQGALGGNATGGSSSRDSASPGGDAGLSGAPSLVITNSGVITINNVNMGGSGAALYAQSLGGTGGAGDAFNNPIGGSGGDAAGSVIINSGAITAIASGASGFGGIMALGQGGPSGSMSGVGGYGGASSVSNSAPVSVNWTWQGVQSSSPDYGLYGIIAQSVGANGSSSEDGGGGHGGDVTSAAVTLTQGGNVSVVTAGGAPSGTAVGTFNGAGVAAVVIGGNGGGGQDSKTNVRGGAAGTSGATAAQITITDASVTTQGDRLPALLAFAQAGTGGTAIGAGTAYTGGDGGNTGNSTISVTAMNNALTFSTLGSNASAIVNLLQAGAGGAGADLNSVIGGVSGAGGAGGSSGTSTVSLLGSSSAPISVSTNGSESAGIYAVSIGSAGGNGGALNAGGGGKGGVGGAGGGAGNINILVTSTTISTEGDGSPGIVAQSQGGAGGQGGTAQGGVAAEGAAGGSGGNSGKVTVSTDSATSITTTGGESSGIVAQGGSGAGGDAGSAAGTISTGGNGGNGGPVGTITVTNGGQINTSGNTSRGIIAQAVSGGGGAGGGTFGVVYSGAGSGASTGPVGDMTITNNGSITTAGANAQGILAQSLAGGGGAGGSASGVVANVGGNASTNPLNADAGAVTITGGAGSSIATTGISSIGILGQSIGGGGGDGGGASGVEVNVGGSGGAGGAGGTILTVLTNSTLSTAGDGAHGIVMQSVGGGGGNAGNSIGGLGLFTSVAVGGTGGNGGSGGQVTVDLTNSNITLQGSNAAGLVVQSIGGGGGTGGGAFTGSIGAGFSASVAVGGTAGGGGNGQQAMVQLIGGSISTGQDPSLISTTTGCGGPNTLPCNQLPVDAYGVVVQSIGGGGGVSGSASARALAIGLSLTPTGSQVSLSSGIAIGGGCSPGGGSCNGGGSGGAAVLSLSGGASITTSGQGSTGVLLQSIGGGGGAGGNSSAMSAALGYSDPNLPSDGSSLSVNANFALGGSGGGGGNGGQVNFALGGTISMSGGTPTFFGEPTGTAASTITTYGDFASGIKAQSIGGGGGDAGYGSGNTQSFGTGNNINTTVALGATGGSGGNGGAVALYLSPTGAITTWGSNAMGVVAQSIGGGGGTSSGGGFSVGGTAGSAVVAVNVHVGNQGGTGGTGGQVTIDALSPIVTHGGDAVAILAQSIGGGGGVGGSAGSDASADNPIVAALNAREGVSNISSGSVSWVGTFTQSIGGTGGQGNTGGAVTVELSSALTTSGDWASGIVAQSIGGGGGKGGTAAAAGTGGRPDITINANVAVGGTGGTGGDGGNVTINLANGSIRTAGFAASGVTAQSIGGGGGFGADGSDFAWGLLSVGANASGGGGVGGNGGSVNLSATNTNAIVTTGEAAMGVVLQSVGGGGGIAGMGSGIQFDEVRQAGSQSLKINIGAQGDNVGGSGGAVTFADTGTTRIQTQGNNAYGIVAQSTGGGGGIVLQSEVMGRLATTSPNTFQTIVYGGGSQDSFDNGGNVSVVLNTGSSITTTGSGAHGIIAQSVGGGGGIAGLPGNQPSLTTTQPAGANLQGNGYGNGGAVTVTNNGTINVSGYGAIGILAQSVGGSGGLILASDVSGASNVVYMGSTALNQGNQGSGGAVTVTSNGSVTASGTNGVGIFAQSTGPSGSVTVNANNVVASGDGGRDIWIDSPTDSQVTVGSGGALSAGSGKAIEITGGGKVDVVNNGSITSALALNGGRLTNFGLYNPDADITHDVVNGGTMIHRDGHVIGAVTVTTLSGGLTQFLDVATAAQAHLVTNAGGMVDISGTTSGLTVASIAGSGIYYLGARQLTVGGDNSSTTVGGTIGDNGNGGSLVKTGTGTLTLTGANSYTGGTTVQAGILQGNTLGLQGDILNQSSVVFDQTGAGTYAGVLSGTGTVTVQGGGPVIFTGANTYTGATSIVSGGRLLVNGSITSPVTVGSGGTLGGSGTIFGDVTNNGIVQPGDSFVTLSINGTYVQNAGGTYAPSVNAVGQSDLVAVTGTATLAGAFQAVGTSGGRYARTTSYTVLTTTGALTGTFESVTGTLPFLAPSLAYGANSLTLTLTQAFAAGAIGANQHAVGAALDHASASATGDFATLLSTLAGLDSVQGPKALDAISGQPLANAGTASVETGSAFLTTIGNQISITHGGGDGGSRVAMALSDGIEACDVTCDVAPTVIGTWLSGVGGFGSVPGNATAGGTTYSFGGTAVGADYRFGPNFLAGISAGYVSGRQWANGFDGSTNSDTFNGSLYASFTEGAFYLDGLAGYANTTNRSLRNIVIPGLAVRTARGQTSANQFLSQLESGYRFDGFLTPALSVTPFARVQGSTSTQAGFTESGADSLNLTVAPQTTNSLRSTLGAELGARLEKIQVGVRLGWLHELADTSRPMTAAFAGASGSPFTVFGATPQRDSAAIGFFGKARIADSTEIYARYDGEVGGGTDNHAFSAGLRMTW